ncbi:sigma-54 dependent transcriptional regulator [Desulfovibrio sp. OttesenSCG-928-C06]|nr:sigma-54 dependent transcriptional regulator [Desulfovibrio sp. OttesenSCG-928-C06]
MRILVVDDNPDSLQSLGLVLRDLGHEPTAMQDSREALAEASRNFYPLIISDIRMPGLTGLELLEKIKADPVTADSDVLLITGYADIESAVQALRCGAYDYLNKPINAAELSVVVERCAAHQELLKENISLKHDLDKAEEVRQELSNSLAAINEQLRQISGIGEVVAESQQMRALMDEALIFHANPGVPVLVEGETGTGKEILARLIHYGIEDGSGSARRSVETPFVALNCSAIPAELFGSELFGHEQGAFTGSRAEGAAGKLELAGSGTLFLDEISEMPYDMQPKLLRVLEDRTFYRLGGKHERKFKARVICAGNRSLERMVDAGLFRRDLYHRLSVGHLVLPPLRERQDEIDALAMFFLKREAKQKKKRFTAISPAALEMMHNYPWLGNVRELRNAIERAVLLNDDQALKPEHLSFLVRPAAHVGLVAQNGHVSLPGQPGQPSQSGQNGQFGHAGQIGQSGQSMQIGQNGQNGQNWQSAQAGTAAPNGLGAYADGKSGIYSTGQDSFVSAGDAYGASGALVSSRPQLDLGDLVLPDAPLDLEKLNDAIILKAMDKFGGNKSKAAEYLNISRFALHRRLKKD